MVRWCLVVQPHVSPVVVLVENECVDMLADYASRTSNSTLNRIQTMQN